MAINRILQGFPANTSSYASRGFCCEPVAAASVAAALFMLQLPHQGHAYFVDMPTWPPCITFYVRSTPLNLSLYVTCSLVCVSHRGSYSARVQEGFQICASGSTTLVEDASAVGEEKG